MCGTRSDSIGLWFAPPTTYRAYLSVWWHGPYLPSRGGGDVGLTSTHRRTRADNCQSHCRAFLRGGSAVCLGGWADATLAVEGSGEYSSRVGGGVVVTLVGFPCKMAPTRGLDILVLSGCIPTLPATKQMIPGRYIHLELVVSMTVMLSAYFSRTHLMNGQKISTTSHPVLSTAQTSTKAPTNPPPNFLNAARLFTPPTRYRPRPAHLNGLLPHTSASLSRVPLGRSHAVSVHRACLIGRRLVARRRVCVCV